jgi:type IV pilus assembly protein PilP
MSLPNLSDYLRAAALIALAAITSGCTGDNSDLERYIAEVKARPGGRIEPLPVIRPYESFAYEAYDLRSPFMPDTPMGPPSAPGGGLRPNPERSREFLEQFPLDTLSMVGTMTVGGAYYGLVQTPDTLVHRVQAGNYVGQNDGRIVAIGEEEIKVIEIVPDGIGGYIERSASIGLDDA